MEPGSAYLSGTAADQPKDENELREYKLLLCLAEGFDDAEAAAVLDVFGWTAYRASISTVRVVVTGLHELVNGAFGASYATDVPFERVDAADFDALIIPGGFHNLGYDEAYCDEFRDLARAMHEAGKPIGSMCVGILPIAESGILAGGEATTYRFSSRHDNAGKLAECGATVVDAPVVEWNGIVSCSGPALSEEVCMRVLALVAGDAAASEVARYRTGIDARI